MTARVLTKPMLHNMKHNIIANRKTTIIITIMHLLAFPLLLINTVYSCLIGIDTNPDDVYILIAVAATFIAGISGIIIAMYNFRYLYNKSLVDMCLSQPMTRKQRFISDTLSGLISYVVPFIAVSIVSGIILLIGYLTMDGKTYYFYDGMGERTSARVMTFFSEFAPIFGNLILYGILTMLMLFMLTVLVMTCCGTIFESVLYTVLVNAAIPVFIALVYEMWFSNVYGVDLQDKMFALFSVTSPAGCIAQLCYGTFSGYYYNDVYLLLWQWLIGYVIVMAAIILGAYFLYMKRKAEQVSKPFVFKGLYYILITMITVCITCFIDEVGGAEISAVFIITFVCYMILEVVSRRGFVKIWHGIIRYAATMLLLVGFATIVEATDCFGIENKVPSPGSVSKIYIANLSIDNNHHSNSFSFFRGDPDIIKEKCSLIELDSDENINAVVNAHNEIVNAHNDKTTYVSPISVCYILNNGTRLVRSYTTIPATAMEYLFDVEITEEYKVQAAAYVREEIESIYDKYEKQIIGNNEYAQKPRSVPFDIHYSGISGDMTSYVYYPSKGFFNQLAAAMESDILNMTADEYFHSTAETEFIMNLWYREYLIDSNYRETMAVLAEYGYNLIFETEYLEQRLKNTTENEGITIAIYSPDEYEEITGLSGSRIYYGANFDIPKEKRENGIKYVRYYSDELVEIFKSKKPVYISDKSCYTIKVGGRFYAVPYDMTETAERLYEQAVTIRKDDNDIYRYYTGVAY